MVCIVSLRGGAAGGESRSRPLSFAVVGRRKLATREVRVCLGEGEVGGQVNGEASCGTPMFNVP